MLYVTWRRYGLPSGSNLRICDLQGETVLRVSSVVIVSWRATDDASSTVCADPGFHIIPRSYDDVRLWRSTPPQVS